MQNQYFVGLKFIVIINALICHELISTFFFFNMLDWYVKNIHTAWKLGQCACKVLSCSHSHIVVYFTYFELVYIFQPECVSNSLGL